MSRKLKIAIVDDEPDMRESISQWLVLSGFETETYPSAEDALKVIGADWPGIVVSDIRMPGMDGIELLGRVRAIHRDLPIIICTAYGDIRSDFGTWASDAFLTKSADLRELKAKIREFLG